jgi:drug/metabolite transporter (DMT)-like permease
MPAAALALLAAVAYAAGLALTKRYVVAYPQRQLVGVLYLANAVVIAPAAPFGRWHWTWHIVFLLACSVATMGVTAFLVFELLYHGTAASVTTGTALSPLPAALLAAVLLPKGVTVLHGVVAAVVAVGVIVALGGEFGVLRARHAVPMVALAATGSALITVLAKLLTNAGAGIVQIYLIRTACAGLILCAIFPPRDLPARATPKLLLRGMLITTYFALQLLAVQRGSPVTVQTLVATAPLLLLIGTFAVHRERPSLRATVAALAVVVGVLAVIAT